MFVFLTKWAMIHSYKKNHRKHRKINYKSGKATTGNETKAKK